MRASSALAFIASCCIASTAFAQLVPAVGPGTGSFSIEHVTTLNGGNSAFGGPAVFAPGGLLLTAGNGFPILGAPQAGFDLTGPLTANVPVTRNTPANGAVPGIISAHTTLVGVGGGNRFGLIAPLPSLDVGVVPNGGIGYNAFGGSVDYVNIGAGVFAANVVAATAGTINLLAPGDFGAIAIRAKIEVGVGVGFGFIPTSSAFLDDIIVRFDGAGGLLDSVIADIGFFNQPNATTLNFSVASVGAFALNPGATLRLTATQSLVADPASFTPGNLDPQLLAQLPAGFVGFIASQDAASIIPEPTTVGMLAMATLALGCYRRGGHG